MYLHGSTRGYPQLLRNTFKKGTVYTKLIYETYNAKQGKARTQVKKQWNCTKFPSLKRKNNEEKINKLVIIMDK